MAPQIIFLLVAFLLASAGAPFKVNPPSLHEIYQFPNGTWIENIAVRNNGNILVTLANAPELWEVISTTKREANQARLVHNFTRAEMTTGITELASDVFAVATPDSVWKVDLNDHGKRVPTRLATLPAGNLNGMATLNRESGTVVISDSQAGLVWRLDTNTGNYTVILKDETMAANTKEGLLLGINGIQVHGDYVYYVNTPERLFCRIPVDLMTGQAVGATEIISRNAIADDFAISDQGVVYLAGLRENVAIQLFANGTQKVVAGSRNSTTLMTATSAAFGCGLRSSVLYITTGGETDHPTDSTASRGGKVMALALGH